MLWCFSNSILLSLLCTARLNLHLDHERVYHQTSSFHKLLQTLGLKYSCLMGATARLVLLVVVMGMRVSVSNSNLMDFWCDIISQDSFVKRVHNMPNFIFKQQSLNNYVLRGMDWVNLNHLVECGPSNPASIRWYNLQVGFSIPVNKMSNDCRVSYIPVSLVYQFPNIVIVKIHIFVARTSC